MKGVSDVSADPFQPLNPRIALEVGHPLRVELLEKLQNRTASARELADELPASIGQLDYHLARLREADCIVVQSERTVGSATERLYTAKPGILAGSSPDWGDLPLSARDLVASAGLNAFLETLTGAADAGTVKRTETLCSTETLMLDEVGWKMANRVIQGTLVQLRQLHHQCEARAYVTESDLIPTVIGLAMFEAARPPAQDAGDAEAK